MAVIVSSSGVRTCVFFRISLACRASNGVPVLAAVIVYLLSDFAFLVSSSMLSGWALLFAAASAPRVSYAWAVVGSRAMPEQAAAVKAISRREIIAGAVKRTADDRHSSDDGGPWKARKVAMVAASIEWDGTSDRRRVAVARRAQN